ncbi:hypothetical protein BDW68DRAFT_173528 [Aspergillus falconensis]
MPVYALDTEGNVTLVVHNVSQDLPADLKDLSPDITAGKYLALSPPYFARMFKSGFQKSTELRSKGNAELHIGHDKARQMLTGFAVLVDYHGCYDSPEVFSDMRIAAIDKDGVSTTEEAMKCLLISWVFSKGAIFIISTQTINRTASTTVTSNGPPIPVR